MKEGVTLRDLAALAGCTHTTVSMALRNHPRVSEKTRRRIQRLAEKHGYRRDPLLTTLMGRLRAGRRRRETETLGIINYWDTEAGDRNTFLGKEQYEGILERASVLGYRVDYLWAREPGMTNKRLNRVLQARGIRGILLLSMFHARGHITLEWPKFAAATIGYSIFKPELHRATYSHYHAMFLAMRSLRHRGYVRIGFANLIAQEDVVNNAWLSAYLGYHYRVLNKPPIPPLLLDRWEEERLGKWIAKHRVEVVLSSNPDPYFLMCKMGMRVPRDIGYASLDCIPGILDCAGIRQPRNRVGAKAIELVVEQLENQEFGIPKVPKVMTINGFWQDGPTLNGSHSADF
jgi:DNA-binding LacI/PurR family transcriptional regulator